MIWSEEDSPVCLELGMNESESCSSYGVISGNRLFVHVFIAVGLGQFALGVFFLQESTSLHDCLWARPHASVTKSGTVVVAGLIRDGDPGISLHISYKSSTQRT